MTPQKFVGKKIKTALFHLNKVSIRVTFILEILDYQKAYQTT